MQINQTLQGKFESPEYHERRENLEGSVQLCKFRHDPRRNLTHDYDDDDDLVTSNALVIPIWLLS